MSQHKVDAEGLLGYLRCSPYEVQVDQYAGALDGLREAIKEGGFSLADIGTDEEELRSFELGVAKSRALGLLEYLRSGTLRRDNNAFKSYLDGLREAIKEGGFSLADIGTSEAELEELTKPRVTA